LTDFFYSRLQAEEVEIQ